MDLHHLLTGSYPGFHGTQLLHLGVGVVDRPLENFPWNPIILQEAVWVESAKAKFWMQGEGEDITRGRLSSGESWIAAWGGVCGLKVGGWFTV